MLKIKLTYLQSYSSKRTYTCDDRAHLCIIYLCLSIVYGKYQVKTKLNPSTTCTQVMENYNSNSKCF